MNYSNWINSSEIYGRVYKQKGKREKNKMVFSCDNKSSEEKI